MAAKENLLRKPKGAPPWMVTFADLMALLFALFVLILSFSDVDSDSFKRNAGPIAAAFNQPRPIMILKKDQSSKSKFEIPQQQPREKTESTQEAYLRTVARTNLENLIKSSIANELLNNIIELVIKDNLIIMRFPASAAFASGSADLSTKIFGTIDRIADVLARTEGKILVAGHSDDTPISTARFRSNWDLSTARAVSVVHRLLRHAGLDQKRVSATGYASTQPLVENDSPENRQRNRRVEVVVEIPTPK